MNESYVHLNCGRLDEAKEPSERSLELSGNGVSDFKYSLSLTLKKKPVFLCGEL